MIAVDASAMLAILLDEPERQAFRNLLTGERSAVISPVNWWEAAVRMRAVNGESGVRELHRLCDILNIRIAPVDAAQTQKAFDAHLRFGRGTPAALNLGDCFAYALAATEGDGLLYKGADFPRTDVRSVL